ncbi:MAG: hypothetical protein WA210_09315 [Burkholderiaceae bacterium]
MAMRLNLSATLSVAALAGLAVFAALAAVATVAALALGMALVAGAAQAGVITPTYDAQVIEVLPGASGPRRDDRRLRQQWSAQPGNAALAVALAKRYLERSRELGDPRFAGQAMATLQAWPDAANAPDEVLLMLATLQQYVHEFDAAAENLERLVRRSPGSAQGWLTLATVRRVQGRLAASQQACEGLGAAGALFHARACSAENSGLLGEFDHARSVFNELLATRGAAAPTRAWLMTSLAELESRAGRFAAAETAFRQALEASADQYTLIALVDHLLRQGRNAEALVWLKNQPRSDAVLLRLAMAGVLDNTAPGRSDANEMRLRVAQASLRPQARAAHAREQAMFALWVDGQPQRALELARENIRKQREPTDVLVFAQAARASGQREALLEVEALRQEIGLHDRRIDELL